MNQYEKDNNPVEKWVKSANGHFIEGSGREAACKPMERCPASLAMWKMQIQTTARSHFTPTRLADFAVLDGCISGLRGLWGTELGWGSLEEAGDWMLSHREARS